MEPLNFHFLAILGKKGTFGTQWQSLINSPEIISTRSKASEISTSEIQIIGVGDPGKTLRYNF